MLDPSLLQTKSYFSTRQRINRYTAMVVLTCILSLAFLCVLIPVLQGWVAILLLQLKFGGEDVAWFIVLNMLTVVLVPALILVVRRTLALKRGFELDLEHRDDCAATS